MPRTRSLPGASAALALALLGSACAQTPASQPPAKIADDRAFQREAANARIQQLELELTRLRSDLDEAEQTLVSIESGLQGDFSRAEAVARVAEARIQLERAQSDLPWQADALEEASAKLQTAETQLGAGHYGAAIFFASRTARLAVQSQEAAALAQAEGSRRIGGKRVNLRTAPSLEGEIATTLVRDTPVVPEREEGEWVLVRTPRGQIGWVHGSLLR